MFAPCLLHAECEAASVSGHIWHSSRKDASSNLIFLKIAAPSGTTVQ